MYKNLIKRNILVIYSLALTLPSVYIKILQSVYKIVTLTPGHSSKRARPPPANTKRRGSGGRPPRHGGGAGGAGGARAQGRGAAPGRRGAAGATAARRPRRPAGTSGACAGMDLSCKAFSAELPSETVLTKRGSEQRLAAVELQVQQLRF